MQANHQSFPYQSCLFFFIILHVFIFTLAPFLVRYNLPLDSIEGAMWGHQLEWGYDKNPYLNGWLTALALYLGGPSGWMIYLFSQISVGICIFTLWLLGKEIFPKSYAFIAVLVLEGLQYFNIHAIDFNDNTLELSLWALTTYFFYRAVRPQLKPSITVDRERLFAWLGTGIAAGLGVMAKYYTFALLTPMAWMLFTEAEIRKQLSTLPPYLGLSIFLSILFPHLLWLTKNHYVTIAYIFTRTGTPNSLWDHFSHPLQFALQQLLVFLPTLFLFSLLFLGKKPVSFLEKYRIKDFNRRFLFYIALGPFLLTLLLSLLTGIELHSGWGVPLLSLWSLLLFTQIQPHLSYARLRSFFIGIIAVILLIASVYSYTLMRPTRISSANFPGKIIAQTIEGLWQKNYGTPLSYVAGSRWLSGNIQFYSESKPSVFVNWNPLFSPWIDRADLEKKGGVFVWDIRRQEQLPENIKAEFRNLTPSKILTFNWHRNDYGFPPVQIGIAFLPPKVETE